MKLDSLLTANSDGKTELETGVVSLVDRASNDAESEGDMGRVGGHDVDHECLCTSRSAPMLGVGDTVQVKVCHDQQHKALMSVCSTEHKGTTGMI